jgi:hypothetical protein
MAAAAVGHSVAHGGCKRNHLGAMALETDPAAVAFEAIVRSILKVCATAADGGDLSGTPRQAVEAVAFRLISDAAIGLPAHQRHAVLIPTASSRSERCARAPNARAGSTASRAYRSPRAGR